MAGEHVPGSVKTFACPNCGGTVEVRAPGQTLVAVCKFCQTSLDLLDPNYKILQKYKDKLLFEPLIPIGSRGEIHSISWEVIGFMVRRSERYHINWEEYLLFNPIQGFRWLIHDHGHWSLYENPIEKPRRRYSHEGYSLHGKDFKSFSSGDVSVLFALGEFYWQVKRGDKVNVRDFISPPYVLSIEQDEQGISWALGEYLEPKKIREAFGKEIQLPKRQGVGMNQPNPGLINLRQVLPIAGILVALLLVLKIFFSSQSSNETIFSKTYSLQTPDSTFAVEKVSIPGKVSNVEVLLSSNVDNNWMEIEGNLSPEKTAKSYGFRTGTEYYYGSDGGEKWSEGSKKNSVLINLVSPGEYTLLLQALTQGSPNPSGLPIAYKPVSFTVTIKKDVPLGSNFLLTLLLLLLYPGLQLINYLQFEKLRQES